MPITYLNVTAIAHDSQLLEAQLLYETGRKVVLDPSWSYPPPSASGLCTFLYNSTIEFILIRTYGEVEFRRIIPVMDSETVSMPRRIRWDCRLGEQFYIFKVDPKQKVSVAGHTSVRYFRSVDGEEEGTSGYEESGDLVRPREAEDVDQRRDVGVEMEAGSEDLVRPWEAEDVYRLRDGEFGEAFLPEHLAEVKRRFEAWRATTTGALFVYLMVPMRLGETEWVMLWNNGVQFFDDVPWVVRGGG